jgi:uncharacterized membrane protein
LEFPVHWPAAMSRRQLKNDDRCPQNNLTLLHTQRKIILYHLALSTQPWYFYTFISVHILMCNRLHLRLSLKTGEVYKSAR